MDYQLFFISIFLIGFVVFIISKVLKIASNIKTKQSESEIYYSDDELKAYRILGVDRYDSDATIKRAYQKLVNRYSPKKQSFKSYKQNKYGPDKDEPNIYYEDLQNVIWAWNVINAARKSRKNSQSTQNSDTDTDSDSNATNNTDEYDYKYCLLVLYALVMNADDKQMVCELDVVKNTIRRYYKTEEQQIEALQKFKSILGNVQESDEIYETLNRCLNYVAKSELIMELLALAHADNDFDLSEETAIKDIAMNLNLKAEKYKSIYTLFKKKYEEGQYKTGNGDKDSKKNNNKNSNSKKHNHSNKSNSQPKSKTSVSEAYDILGVSGDISDAEIKKSYRALAVKYHPDNAANLGDEAIRQATETMKQINVAWETVKMARGMK